MRQSILREILRNIQSENQNLNDAKRREENQDVLPSWSLSSAFVCLLKTKPSVTHTETAIAVIRLIFKLIDNDYDNKLQNRTPSSQLTLKVGSHFLPRSEWEVFSSTCECNRDHFNLTFIKFQKKKNLRNFSEINCLHESFKWALTLPKGATLIGWLCYMQWCVQLQIYSKTSESVLRTQIQSNKYDSKELKKNNGYFSDFIRLVYIQNVKKEISHCVRWLGLCQLDT